MPEFDDHIAVRPAPAAREGVSTFAGDLTPGWTVGGGINGGYQLAVLGQAVRAALAEHGDGKPDPLAVSAYYLSPATPGPVTVDVEPRRVGGSVATVAADLRQGDAPGEGVRITALATFGDLSASEPVRTSAPPLDLPPRERCVSNEHAPPEIRSIAPLMDRFEMLFHPDQIGWAVGRPSGRGELSAWFRLLDRDPDVISLLTVVDALPPVTFDLGLMGWAPTLELGVHVRARPAPGWLRVRHRTRTIVDAASGASGAMFEEDCEVWDSADRLVAQSRQLARVPRPV